MDTLKFQCESLITPLIVDATIIASWIGKQLANRLPYKPGFHPYNNSSLSIKDTTRQKDRRTNKQTDTQTHGQTDREKRKKERREKERKKERKKKLPPIAAVSLLDTQRQLLVIGTEAKSLLTHFTRLIRKWELRELRTCLHGGGGPQVGEITRGGLPHLSGLPHLPGAPISM